MAAFLNCIIFWVLYYFELQVEEDKQIQGILYVSLSKMWQCDVIRTLWKISEIEYKSGIYWWFLKDVVNITQLIALQIANLFLGN